MSWKNAGQFRRLASLKEQLPCLKAGTESGVAAQQLIDGFPVSGMIINGVRSLDRLPMRFCTSSLHGFRVVGISVVAAIEAICLR